MYSDGRKTSGWLMDWIVQDSDNRVECSPNKLKSVHRGAFKYRNIGPEPRTFPERRAQGIGPELPTLNRHAAHCDLCSPVGNPEHHDGPPKLLSEQQREVHSLRPFQEDGRRCLDDRGKWQRL